MKFDVYKARGQWWVLDQEGYEISYVGHDTKKEAMTAAAVMEKDPEYHSALHRLPKVPEA